jgi:putative Mg2+ transporter-C (MgtC) family protein
MVELEIVGRLALAALLGGVIGLERWRAGKPAGLRTLTLICIGAAAFTVVAIYTFGLTDGSRIVAGIVTGIGFIGAGSIMHREQGIVGGLTTAAGIWVVAAIGMAVGAGMYIIATVTTALILIVLLGMKRFEGKHDIH